MANVLPQLGLTAQNMDDVISAVESGNVPLGEIITDIIKGQEYRDRVMRGLYQRFVGKPASAYDYSDPRMADGVPIYARQKMGANINHKLHFAFDKMIATNKASYAASDISVNFDSEILQTDEDALKQIYNDIESNSGLSGIMNSCMSACADRGTSYIVFFSNNNGINVTKDNEWETVVIYNSSTGEPQYALRYMLYLNTYFLDGYRIPDRPETQEYLCEWYDGLNVTYYQGVIEDIRPSEIDGVHTRPHMFGTADRPGIPVIELPNNEDSVSDVELSLSLQDAYDVALSDLSSEVTQMRLAYLIMRMVGQNIDAEFKQQLQDTGVIAIDNEYGSVDFLQKNLDSAAVMSLREVLKEGIYKFSFSYDPDDLASGSPTAFQIRQKLAGLEQSASQTLNLWDHQLKYMDYIIQTYLLTFRGFSEYDLSGISRNYVRNVPRDRNQELIEVRNAGGIVSNDYIIRLSTLSNDVDLEQNQAELQEQNAAMFEPMGFEGMDTETGDMAAPEPAGAEPAVSVSGQAGKVGEETGVVQLNGAQVSSAMTIVERVGEGRISMDAGRNLLKTMFNLSDEVAASLLEGMDAISPEGENEPT